MKAHTSQFKNTIKEFGRELDSKITYTLDNEEIELGSEELNSITPHYEGAILKSVMKQLDIDSNIEIPIGTILRYQFGVKVGNEYEYIDYGNYVVYKAEKQEDTRSWQITCYDKMLYSMKDYENSNITFPITIKDYLIAICEKVGLEYEGSQFANSDKVIDNELYLDNEGRSLDYTFRDVLDEIAQVSGGTICINNDDELEVRYIHDVGELQSQTGSSLTLETDDAIKLDSFELEGKTTQETRSGKNLLGIPDVNYSGYGITIKSTNGVITINGTTTDTLLYDFNLISPISSSLGTLTKSLSPSGTYNGIQTSLRDNSTNNVGLWSNNASNNTGTISANAYKFRIQINSGITINATIKPQIEVGSSATSWEQYGVMPSPDYPSELVSVGYENLLNFASIIPATASTTVTLLDTGINLKNTSNGYGAKINIANLKANTDYYISYKWENVSNGLNRVYVFAGSAQATTLAYLNNGTGFKFNTGNNTSINIWFYVQANSTGEVNYKDIQLLEGIQTHSYIPYGKYGIELNNFGKNLFDEDQLLNADGWSKNDNGYYYGLRDRLYRNFRSENGGFKFNFKFKENTQYTISFIAYASVNSGNARFEIRYTDGSSTWTNYWNTTSPTRITRVSVENKTIASISFGYGSGGGTTDYLKDILLEEGNKNPEYEEYKSNTYLYTLDNPLRSIGNTKDLLYIKNGMLYVERKIGSVVLDGSESSWNITNNGTIYAYWLFGSDLPNYKQIKAEKYSNYFKYENKSWKDSSGHCICENSGSVAMLIFRMDTLTSLSAWKTWLSTHNTEVQYELAEPYTEELGQVEMPSTYEGITYIETTDSNEPTINVSYISETEEIDEEYLKDVNVNFGEKFGPVNTIVLSRGGDGDKISLSIPSDLADEDKVAIQITDNQIMNDNNRADYMQPILNQLYGLEYCINDFSSTGICYLDLCDRYNIKIDDNIYKCIMFNDEVNITQGLQESIYTDMQEENEQEYKYIGSTDRGITQANIIANKAEATITEYTQKVDNATNRLNAVEAKQTETDRTINIISTNIDANGNITEVTTTTGFTFNAEGMTIADNTTNFKALHRNTGTYYYDGDTITGQYTKDGSKQKDLQLFGVYYYGMKDINDTPMFVAQLYTDKNGEECFGHFYNRGD